MFRSSSLSDLRQVVKMAVDIAAGVAQLHHAGVIHRFVLFLPSAAVCLLAAFGDDC